MILNPNFTKEQVEFLNRVMLPVPDIPTGRKLIEEINKETSKTLAKMRSLGEQQVIDNRLFAVLEDYSYDLKKARNKVQSEMTSIFKTKKMAEGGNATNTNAV